MSERSQETLLERYLSLVEIARVLASTLDLDRLLFQIVKAAAILTNSNAASIMLYDESKNELYFQSSTNLDTKIMRGIVIPVDNSLAGTIIKTRKPIIVMNTGDDPRHYQEVGKFADYETESLLGVPMITKDKIVGVLEVINKIEGEFSEEDQDLLSALGSQAAIAIENTRLFQQSDLISEMVHELRTPLASIQTASHLLSRPELKDEQRTMIIETIQKESERLSDMTTSFLDFARLESGRVEYKKQLLDLEKLLRDAANVMQGQIDEKGLTLNVEITPPLPKIFADADKLKQVMLNLLSNAVKYNRPKGTITMGASKYKQQVSFYIRDTGIGMKPEHVKQLFQKFYRVPGSEKAASGTGLGLTISKKDC